MFVRRHRGDALAIEARERYAGPGGHVARGRPVEQHLETGAQRPLGTEHGDRLDEVREQPVGDGRGQLAAPDVDAFVALPLQRRATDIVAVDRPHGDARHGVGEDRDLVAVAVQSELVPVERQSRLEAQGITRTEPGRHGAEIDQALPKLDRPVAVDEQLEAHRLAGIAGARCNHVVAVDRHDREPVALVLGQQVGGAGRLLEDFGGAGTLQRDHRQRFADVVHLGVGRFVSGQPLPVLLAVGGVDDEQEVVASEHIQVGVVDGAAVLVGDDRILGMARHQCPGIVGQRLEEERFGAAAGDAEAAHVGDVEQSGMAARGEVLADDPGRVLHRHVPAAEPDHLGARRLVPAVQDGFLKRGAIVHGHRPPGISLNLWKAGSTAMAPAGGSGRTIGDCCRPR